MMRLDSRPYGRLLPGGPDWDPSMHNGASRKGVSPQSSRARPHELNLSAFRQGERVLPSTPRAKVGLPPFKTLAGESAPLTMLDSRSRAVPNGVIRGRASLKVDHLAPKSNHQPAAGR